MDIEKKVKELIAEQLDVDFNVITNESELMEDLGADSLDFVELIMSIEEEFDIEISDEKAENMETVQDVIDYLKEATEPDH